MKKALCLWTALLLLAAVCGFAQGEGALTVENVMQSDSESFSCSFDGVKHSFLLFLPDESEGAPLVVMLPGYGNTAAAFRTQVHFEVEANAQGYAVVYVTGAPDPNVRTSAVCWNSEIGREGNRDAEFLAALTEYLQKQYALDEERAYVVGFSNGAFMAHRLATEADGRFTAFVSVAGMMPASVWEARPESNAVGFFQITGEKDDVVPKNSDGSARFAKAPAIEDVVAYWVESNGLELVETSRIGMDSELTKYAGAGKPQQVWNLFVKNGRHSWPSEQFNKIDTNACILAFFEAQKAEA